MSLDWDVVLPVLAACAQAITGVLGWRVTVDGVKKERKALFEWLFALSTVLGIACVGLIAQRGGIISQKLEDIQRGITAQVQHTHMDFFNPMPLYTDSFQPFVVGKSPALNLGYKNGGDAPIVDPSWGGELLLLPRSEVKTHLVFENHIHDLDGHFNVGGSLEPHNAAFNFHSYKIGPLTDTDVKELEAGTKAVCGLAIARWQDQTGHFQTNYCECKVAENTGWEVCGSESNKEHKLPD